VDSYVSSSLPYPVLFTQLRSSGSLQWHLEQRKAPPKVLKDMATNLVDRERRAPDSLSAHLLMIISLGAFAISFGLPILCYLATFFCNDISGCPVPSTLSPSTLSIETLKKSAGPQRAYWDWQAGMYLQKYWGTTYSLWCSIESCQVRSLMAPNFSPEED
jgi:hypothetical protein